MIGRQVSHFYIIRLLGNGGMGVVYEAQDTRLPRSVAVKFLKPHLLTSDDALRRFAREARLASSLNHPNICTVLEVDEAEAQSFIVMELLRGQSLKARLSSQRMTLRDILDIGGQIAGALTAAHDQGIVHRDITPGNVFLTESGMVKLLDFGLAKHVPSPDIDDDSADDVTGPGAAPGTILYMAPERLSGDGAADFRCDLFSLGAILYQMATGAPPFDLSPRSALIAMIREQAEVPLRLLAPEHPAGLERIVKKLLEKQPGDRYQTAREVQAELASVVPPVVGPMMTGSRDLPHPAMSIAVLGFEIIGGADRPIEDFRDGLAEDISRRLSAAPGLSVAPRTSTRTLAGLTASEIGLRLGAEMIVEGTVQLAQGRLRVTANLVDAPRERLLSPTVNVDAAFDASLTLQDQVSQDICNALSPALSKRAPRHEAPDPDAFHAYQRGLHHWRDCHAGGWRPAIEHFEYAIDRDPQFALAHVALANAYNFCGFYTLMKPRLSFTVAVRAAERALAIDRGLAAANRELALAKFGGEWDWDRSEEAFREALRLEPGDAHTHVYYSWLLILLGRDDAAYAEAQRGQGLAPRSRLVATARAQTLYIGGLYEEAIDICSRCLAADPDYVFAAQLRGLCHLACESRDAALADLEQAVRLSHRVPYYLGLLGRCYGQFGMRAEALTLIEELDRQSRHTYVPPQCYVFIYAGLGDPDRALTHQERAYVDGASPFNYLTPAIRSLYALDAYHKERLEQMRLRV